MTLLSTTIESTSFAQEYQVPTMGNCLNCLKEKRNGFSTYEKLFFASFFVALLQGRCESVSAFLQ